MRTIRWAAVTATALLLTSCGADATPETETPAAEAAATTEAPEPLTQEEWVELCMPGEGTDPSNPRCTEDLDADYDEELSEWDGTQGEWVRYRTLNSDDTLHDWSISIDSAKIATTLPDAADNPEYNGGNLDAPERIDAEAADDSEYLVVTYTARNDSNTPDMLPADHAVHFSDGEVFFPSGDDDSIAWNLTDDHDPNVDADYQNPGTEASAVVVFSIPRESEIAALELMDPYIASDFSTTIELTDITR